MINKLKGYLEKQEGEIVGIASTEAVDRDGEVIMQNGWDLTNFKANPVILASHNYYEFPIGKATDIQVNDGKLVFKMLFSQATEKAKEAYQLVQEGILKSFSVGFIPREYDQTRPNTITKAELLEISLVTVPANPEALVLAKGMKDNRLAQDMLKHWLITAKQEGVFSESDEAKGEEANGEEEQEKETEIISDNSTTEVGSDKEDGVEGGETDEEKDFDVKLLQRTVGHLQSLLHEVKTRKAGEKQ